MDGSAGEESRKRREESSAKPRSGSRGSPRARAGVGRGSASGASRAGFATSSAVAFAHASRWISHQRITAMTTANEPSPVAKASNTLELGGDCKR